MEARHRALGLVTVSVMGLVIVFGLVACPAALPAEPATQPEVKPEPATQPEAKPEPQPEPEPASQSESDSDPDGDGVPSVTDLCPDDAGPGENGGCPNPPLVRLGNQRLELEEKIQFDFDKSTIRPASFSLLDEIAQLLVSHPEWGRVEIQGHRNPQQAYGRRISQRRAQSVKAYLMERGVPEERLDAKGYGDTMPLVPHEGYRTKKERDEAWAINRRIEFVLLGVPEGLAP